MLYSKNNFYEPLCIAERKARKYKINKFFDLKIYIENYQKFIILYKIETTIINIL